MGLVKPLSRSEGSREKKNLSFLPANKPPFPHRPAHHLVTIPTELHRHLKILYFSQATCFCAVYGSTYKKLRFSCTRATGGTFQTALFKDPVRTAQDVRIRGYFSKPTGVREQRGLGNTDLDEFHAAEGYAVYLSSATFRPAFVRPSSMCPVIC